MPDEPRLDEQFVSQAIQLGLSNQLGNADNLKVNVRTDLLKAIQGQADSVSVRGQGMVVQDLRVEEMELHTQKLDLNPLSLLLGKLHLAQPLNATSRIVLTEDDINQALNNPAIVNRIPPLQLNIKGQAVAIVLQPPIKVEFPGGGKIAIEAAVQFAEQGKINTVRFSATAYHKIRNRPVLLESLTCHDGGAISLDLMLAMMQRVKDLIELPYLEYEGILFCIREMKAEVSRLVLQVETQMSQIPFGG